MGVIAEGIPRGCQGLFPRVFLGHPLSVFNKNSTLKKEIVMKLGTSTYILAKKCIVGLRTHCDCAP